MKFAGFLRRHVTVLRPQVSFYYPTAFSTVQQITDKNVQIMSTNANIQIQIQIYSHTVQYTYYYKTGFLTGLVKLWQPYNMTTFE